MGERSGDRLEVTLTAERLAALADVIDDEALVDLSRRYFGPPTPDAWRRFTDRVLLFLGAGLFAAGVIFFFAYNWDALGRFARLGIIEGLVIIAGGIAWWRGLDKLSGRVALTAASIFVGGVLAVYGQTYQTGADPWELFTGWAALILPWVIAARFAALTFIEVVLLNTALILFWGQVLRPDTPLALALALVLAVVNGAAWALAEWREAAGDGTLGRWAPRVLALATATAITVPAAAWIFAGEDAGITGPLGLLGLVALSAIVHMTYRQRIGDLFMHATTALAVASWIGFVFARLIFDDLGLDEWGVIAMAVVVVGEVALMTWWLRRLHVEIETTA